ncbi:MAG: S-adenosylmethionine:tRNA ribosyltransferase-isomerase [Cyclobacteriaceae bacterium]|nr:S-adenosylmethionine:tRNA ribosyltransferase-isomerase [Cyclobacteriaceae bacterium]MDH5249058.1 S-adenosylmethionine:tRNA ribosyltransferase-isomerase [Cyclobacteriaceae bacterium]
MQLDVDDFIYSLSAEQIAVYPLDLRDHSKLLVYHKGQIEHELFYSVADYLPVESLLVFNDTKVIPARLHFQKGTGAVIEIFLLNPVLPSSMVLEAMQAENACTWKCTIGNLKRWKEGDSLISRFRGGTIEATLASKADGLVKFKWNTAQNFATVIALIGETPLPPYLKREAEEADRERYQTIYSRCEGAVAAPTAGLHFTPAIFESLRKKKIKTDFVTLHVGAGTFQPIKARNAAAHIMHTEQLAVSRENVENLLRSKYVTAVGTTSLRTIESLYWYGVKLLKDPKASFIINQHDPYQFQGNLPSRKAALTAILGYMDDHRITSISGETSIYILPGYTFKICEALITNFHQPGSTLILLIAAFIGDDWREVYQQALANKYRFLSYGDSSLLIPGTKKQK